MLRGVELLMKLQLRVTRCHLPRGITQCYLPRDTSEHSMPEPQPETELTYSTHDVLGGNIANTV